MRNCNSCGKCCDTAGNGGLSATPDEIDWWETNRPEIARFVQDGKIWVDPETGRYFAACPWLARTPGQKKTSCLIYFDRPEDCRHYPVDIDQMQRHDCEMLEPSDLRDVRKAQQKLDLMMSENRPPAGR
ncbi:MAG: YkgJ family cysteine cluster protein [Gammaproteobacteria bacterium]|nr:YkgJ family cysteine cluster protein [Gammaproteobacteria bacterium]